MGHALARRLGEAEVVVLTDGASSFGAEMFPGADPDHVAALLTEAGESEIRTNFNATLIRQGGRVVLADAGPRDLFGPACGHLPEALAEAGVDPEEVDTFFATHLHPDHVAGALTPGGAAVFPNAELVVQAEERAFWEGEIPGAPEMILDWQRLARALLAAYGDRLRIIAGEAEIAPGVTALPLPGHTPGHSGFRVASGAASLVHVGDIMHAPVVQAADPGIGIVFDVDPAAARAARERMLDRMAAEGALVTGGHLLAPALQRVERHGSGYRMVAA